MKIPLIYADKPLDVVHTPNVGVGEMAQVQVGGEVVELSGLIAQRQAVLQEKERIAQETLQAVESDTEMNKRMAKEKEYFLTSPDYETYDARKTEFLNSLKEEFGSKAQSKEAKIAFARSFNKFSNEFGDFVTSRKYKVMEERSLSAINDLIVQKGEEYAALTDPRDKELKIKSTEMEIRRLMDAGTVSQLVGENKIREIEKTFKAIDIDAAKAAAINRMSTEPEKLAVDLKDPNYFPAWKDKSERAMMANQAETAARIKKDQTRIEIDRAREDARRNDNRKIGDLIMAGDLTAAYALAQKSQVIDGGDKLTWTNAIEHKSTLKTERVPPRIEAEEMAKINDMIRTNLPMDEIRNYIIQTPNLGGEMRKSYIDRVERDYSADIKEMRSIGLSTIQEKIIPKRGLMEKILKTPLEEEAVGRAGIVFMNWFDEQQGAKKRITRQEVIDRALAIGYEHQITTTGKIRFMEEQFAREQEEGARTAKAKEREKKGLPPEAEVVRQKIR